MPEAGKGAGEERLGDLLRTWQETPSPRVGLQLAEEYRRAGRHGDARSVLELSLESHPGHLSSLVALGKTQLDLGEPGAAADRFETVLERDSTHLVAGKLLIEAHLRRGDGAQARRRLEHYRLLNAGDPELDDLERRAGELEDAEPTASEPTRDEEADSVDAAGAVEAAAQDVEPAPQAETGEPHQPAGATPAAAVGGGGDQRSPTAPAAGVDGRATPAAHRAAVEHGAGEPFGALSEAADERRWLAGLAEPGIFPVELPPEPEPPAAVEEEPAPPAEAADPEEAAAVAAEPEAGEAAPLGETAAAAEPGPAEPGLAEPGPAEPEPTEAADVPAEHERATRPAAPEEGSEPTRVGGVAAAPAPAGVSRERATNTLGELYLAQGHLDDAERVFRAVLARRPDDAAAHAGLAEAARRRRGPFDAGALMRWAAERGRPVTGGDRTARSASLLRAYRDRLHREGRRNVP